MKRSNFRQSLVTIIVLIVFYGCLITYLVYLEEGAVGSRMQGMEDGLWYLAATLTTVGYGDIYPVTYWGRIIGFIFLLSSLGVYGFIIGQIANFMSTVRENKALGLNGTDLSNHLVMIGWNDFGQSVISHLVGAGRQVAVVTTDRHSIDIIREFYTPEQVFTLYSDYGNFDLIEKCNIRESSIVFINLPDDTEKLVYIINIKKHYSDLNYVVMLDNGNLKSTFHHAGVTYAVSKNEISSKLLASYIYEPDVAMFSEEILAYAHEDHEYDMKQMLVNSANIYSGVFYEKAFYDLKKDHNVVLIGIVKVKEGKRTLMKNPEGSIKVETGDYLILLLDKKGENKLSRVFNIGEGI